MKVYRLGDLHKNNATICVSEKIQDIRQSVCKMDSEKDTPILEIWEDGIVLSHSFGSEVLHTIVDEMK